MKDRVLIGRKVVITQPHKGRRSKGQDRNGRSGKKGTIYDISGKAETELFSATGFQFKDLQKNSVRRDLYQHTLHSTGVEQPSSNTATFNSDY